LLPWLELAQPLGARADVLDQEVQLAPACPQDAEGARQERPLGLSPAPALGGSDHVELPGSWRRPGGVAAAKDHIGVVRLARDDAGRAAAERRGDTRHATPVGLGSATGARRTAWISCSDSTSGSPRRAAEMARAAAIPPAIVVMH